MKLLLIALGGALGSVMRYLAQEGVHRLFGQAFPWGTLSVNVLGSLAIGYAWVRFAEQGPDDPLLRGFLVIGLMGGFTTFSTFSLETMQLIEAGALGRATTNMLLSVTLCVAACAAGIVLTRQLLN